LLKELISADEVAKILDRLSFQVAEHCPVNNLYIIGIHRRGVTLAKRLHGLMKQHHGVDLPMGAIDITLYRDDLSEIGNFPEVYGTELPVDIAGRNVLLVDDVIYTGRTIRAALDCLADFGRPERIMLLALVDRGHRELPIQPDFVGRSIPTSRKEIVHVNVMEIDGRENIEISERGTK
jgi:pyrimidine operon attenuation protein/uracil phosphoribosyltransferase